MARTTELDNLVDMSGVVRPGRWKGCWVVFTDDGEEIHLTGLHLAILGHTPFDGQRIDFVARRIITERFEIEEVL
jgi:hypothetical protein